MPSRRFDDGYYFLLRKGKIYSQETQRWLTQREKARRQRAKR